MNSSKLIEWLLENDCPFEWEVDEYNDSVDSVTLHFSKYQGKLSLKEVA